MGRNFYCSWRVPKTKVEIFLLILNVFSANFYTLLDKSLRDIPFKLLILYSFGDAQSGLKEVFSILKSVQVSKYSIYGENVIPANCLLPTNNYLLPTYCRLVASNCFTPTAYCRLLNVDCLLPTVNGLLLTAHCRLHTANCSLPIAQWSITSE